MNKILLNICFYIIFFGPTFAQEIKSPLLVKKLVGNFIYFKADELGNVYVLTSSGQLKKYNNNLDSMGVFNDVRNYGVLHYISSGNALRTVLFFKQYRTILLLDRMMQVVNKLDLRKSLLFQVQAIAQSYDNNIWIFDEQESKLKKLSESGKLIFESADLRIVFDEAIQPSQIFDSGGFVYLYDKLKGLYIFDYYGAFKSKVSLLGWSNPQLVGNSIIGIKDEKIMSYKLNSLDISESNLSVLLKSAKQLYFSVTGFMALEEDGIYSYGWGK